MAFFFGLNIGRNLTDISDSEDALANLNLDIKDLDKIRGLTDPGNVSKSDFQGLSGLDVDIEVETASLSAETGNYDILTSNVYDSNSTIDNNLIVNGQFGATAIKYLYVDNAGIIKSADISTSRVSSWSAFDTPITANSPIFYGGEVALEGTLELSSLSLNKAVDQVRFESEIPTHKIRTTINGLPVDLYAMKGIPLVYRGFFRTASVSAAINILGGLRPSWTIKNTDNNIEYVYENRLSGTASAVSFSDTSARQRDISFYYPIDRITQLSLPSISLTTLPAVTLPNLTTLSIENNDIREFPNLSTFSNLRTLNISSNNLTRAQSDSLKTLNSNIVARLPPSITTLSIGNCFTGAASADFSDFASLTTFDINAGGRSNRRLSGAVLGTAPNVPKTIVTYNIQWNLFNRLPENVMDSDTLRDLYIDYNAINQGDLRIDSPALVNFYSDSNTHNLVDVSGKTNLVNYVIYTPTITSGNRIIKDIFNGCSSLSTVSVRYSPVTGAFPPFTSCNALASVDFEGTQIEGATPTRMITSSTFNFCRNTLRFLRLTSSRITEAQVFDTDCFRLMPVLDYVLITSNGAGIGGTLPDFSTARNLSYILMYSNRMTGNIPNFENNIRLFYLHLYNNRLSGSVPNIPHSTFRHLLLGGNRLNTFNELSASNLERIHLQFNRIPQIPNLSNLTILQELFINNQSPAGATRVQYTPGSFVGLRNLRTLNNSNNNMTQGDVNQILVDLDQNYNSNPRGGVTINLRGNSAPSQTELIQNIITKLRAGGWIVQTN